MRLTPLLTQTISGTPEWVFTRFITTIRGFLTMEEVTFWPCNTQHNDIRHNDTQHNNNRVQQESAIFNERESKSFLGRVFNSKLVCFATLHGKCVASLMQPLLIIETWTNFS